MKRLLVVTADDFGFSKERNDGIMEAFRKGAVKSASLLLNCTGSEDGAVVAKKENVCLGLHLNLTEGMPVNKQKYTALTNEEGIFRGMDGTRKALNDKIIPKEEVQREIQSQIDRFVEVVGEKPAYVDGHQHIHIHPEVAEIFASTLQSNGITVTRFPVEFNIEDKPWLRECPYYNFFLKIIQESLAAKPIYDKYGIRYSDCYTGLSSMGANMSIDRLQFLIMEAFQTVEKNHPDKDYIICELMTHPGFPTSWEHGGFCWGTDDFGASDDRTHEIEVLSSAEMMEFYKKNNIELVSHKRI